MFVLYNLYIEEYVTNFAAGEVQHGDIFDAWEFKSDEELTEFIPILKDTYGKFEKVYILE
jgi:hypothetical protein